MTKSVIGWLVWFITVATLVLFLSAAERGKKESELSGPKRPLQEYHLYMD